MGMGGMDVWERGRAGGSGGFADVGCGVLKR